MKKQFIVIVLVVLVSLIVDYGIRGYYYPQKDDFESSGTGWILEKGEKIKAENNPPGGLYEVYKINIMMSVSKV